MLLKKSRPRLVTYCDVKGADKVKRRLDELERIISKKATQQILNQTGKKLQQHWKNGANKHFNSSSKPVQGKDGVVLSPGAVMSGKWSDWQRVPSDFRKSAAVVRPSTGRLAAAGRYTISQKGRLSFYIDPIPQITSYQPKHQGKNVVDFLRTGVPGGPGAFDPVFGKRKVLMVNGETYWHCGTHPGTTGEQWALFMLEFKSAAKKEFQAQGKSITKAIKQTRRGA